MSSLWRQFCRSVLDNTAHMQDCYGSQSTCTGACFARSITSYRIFFSFHAKSFDPKCRRNLCCYPHLLQQTGFTALMLAAKCGQLEIVRKLITYKARLDVTDQVSSPSIVRSIPMHADRLTVSLQIGCMSSYIIIFTDF